MARLHQVYLSVTDRDRSQRFYEEGLGLPVVDRGERSVEFDTGAARLKLEVDHDAETLAAFGLEPPGENRGDGAIVVLDVDDVEAVHDGLDTDAVGGEVLADPMQADWGRKLMLVADPDGYVLEISEATE